MGDASVSLRILQQFGRRNRAGFRVFVPAAADALRGVQLLSGFLLASQVEQHLSADVVGIGTLGIEPDGGIDLRQRQSEFLLLLENLGQAEMGIHQPGIAAQRIAETFFGVVVVLHQPVHFSQFIVVERHIGLHGSVLQKFIPRLSVLLLLDVHESEIEVHEGKLGIGFGGGFKFRLGLIVLLKIEMIFSQEEMVFRSAISDLYQLFRSPVVEVFVSGAMGSIRKHIQIGKLSRFLGPQRFESRNSAGPALGEEIAEAQQIARLHGIGLIPYDGFKRGNCLKEFILAEIGQADVEAYAGHLRHEALGFFKILQRLSPLLAPHVNHAQICVSGSRLGIELKDFAKVTFRFIDLGVGESVLPTLKNLCRVRRL